MDSRPGRVIVGAAIVFLMAAVYAAAPLAQRPTPDDPLPIGQQPTPVLPGDLQRSKPAEPAAGAHPPAPGTDSRDRRPPTADRRPGADPAPTPQSPAPADHRQASDYVGSSQCARCHQEQYDSWHKTLHLQMTKPIAEATVVGDFRPGTHFEAHGRAYKMETRDGRYFITITRGTNPPQTFEVNYTLGARRFQGYLSKLPDGRIYVLPAFWHNENKRWIDWKEITPIPDHPEQDLRQIWNVDCVNCHATNLVKNYDVASASYATTWTEMGIGCEACHGPGAPHIALMDDWAKNPASKPAYDTSAKNRELGATLKIFSPRTADPRKIFDTCGYCHGNKSNKFFGFRPGDLYEDFALPFLISEPIPDNDPQGDFWTDGRPSRFNRNQALTLTGCFMRGEVTCTKCHALHSSRNEHALKVPVMANGKTTRTSDALCTQCHAERPAAAESAERRPTLAGSQNEPSASPNEAPHATAYGAAAVPPTPIPNLQAHTHHAPDSPGSRCIECHMSDVNWRLFTRRRDHSFQPPVPEMTARFGVGNACNTCHDDKSPEWAAKTMDEWYGNRAKRQAVVEMAEVFYRAGAGDTSVLGDVVRYAVDRKRGALVRASAAEFAGQLLTKLAHETPDSTADRRTPTAEPASSAQRPAADVAVVNALAGAAADPEPMVRAEAIRALGHARAPQAVTIVASHLTDRARVVRASAAAALFNDGILRLDGTVGSALVAAQNDWMASLVTFNDMATDHVALGWLEAELGRTDEGSAELEVASRLDPRLAEPHVYLGVIAARAGRFTDAMRQFKTAQSLNPSYANLDRLIEEVQKRIRPGRN